jgi:heptosyltransferase II
MKTGARRSRDFTSGRGAVTPPDWSERTPDIHKMNIDSNHIATEDRDDVRPILIVPYMWIGDFVRGHTVVRVLKQRWPNRPVDLLVTSLCAPLVDYMPDVRAGIVWDLPRRRFVLTRQ